MFVSLYFLYIVIKWTPFYLFSSAYTPSLKPLVASLQCILYSFHYCLVKYGFDPVMSLITSLPLPFSTVFNHILWSPPVAGLFLPSAKVLWMSHSHYEFPHCPSSNPIINSFLTFAGISFLDYKLTISYLLTWFPLPPSVKIKIPILCYFQIIISFCYPLIQFGVISGLFVWVILTLQQITWSLYFKPMSYVSNLISCPKRWAHCHSSLGIVFQLLQIRSFKIETESLLSLTDFIITTVVLWSLNTQD